MKVVPVVNNAEKWTRIMKANGRDQLSMPRNNEKKRARLMPVKTIKEPIQVVSEMQAVVDRAKAQIEHRRKEVAEKYH